MLRLEGNTCLLLLEGQFTRNHSAEKKGNDTCNVLSGHKKYILDQTQRDTDTDFIVSSDCAIFSARVSIKSLLPGTSLKVVTYSQHTAVGVFGFFFIHCFISLNKRVTFFPKRADFCCLSVSPSAPSEAALLYLFISLRSQQLPLIFLQKLNTPVACVIISASLWQRVCTPSLALMLLQLLIMCG